MIRNLGRALTILAAAERASEIKMECEHTVDFGEFAPREPDFALERRARKLAKAVAGVPERIILREAIRRVGTKALHRAMTRIITRR